MWRRKIKTGKGKIKDGEGKVEEESKMAKEKDDETSAKGGNRQ